MADRIAPIRRPSEANAGTQTWQSLLFSHWEISPEQLRAAVPAELEIDTFEDRAFVGVVPFKMRNVRPRSLPKRLALNFLETNVRTYVLHNDRPGVYFFSLDANSRLAVWAARAGWSLPYFYANMSAATRGQRHTYQSQRQGQANHAVTFRVDRELGPSPAGTLEHFLLERYLLFTQRRNQIYVGHVHHQPYHAYKAIIDEINDSLIQAAGLPAITKPPDLAHYSPGVEVEVFAIRKHPTARLSE